MPQVIAQFPSRQDAEYAQGFLEDAGIPSVLEADDAGGAYTGLSFMRSARLMVNADDAADALDVLRDAGVLE